jgi:hypothetical protein
VNERTGLACLPNIGPRERRRRMVLAGVAAAMTLATGAAVLLASAPAPWRLAVFPPAWAAVLCYLEARHRTCVVLAARGLRNLDTGNEPVADGNARRASTAQSRAIYLWSTIVAAIVTAVLLLAPWRRAGWPAPTYDSRVSPARHWSPHRTHLNSTPTYFARSSGFSTHGRRCHGGSWRTC